MLVWLRTYNVDDPHEQKGGDKFRNKGLGVVFMASFRSTKGGEAELFRHKVEEREGDESSSHLTRDSNKALGVGALVEGPHGHRNGGVDVLSVACNGNE